jgi:hypothetical protein
MPRFVPGFSMTMVLLSLLLSTPGSADPIFPPGKYADLDAQMVRHTRQFYAINAVPFGLSLDAHPKAEAVELIDQFLAQEATDDPVEAVGKHAYELLASYGEYGDLGFFGGVGVASTAYAYRALKAEGADEETLALWRERVVRAAESWHIFYVVTGGNGVVARGIRRMVSEHEGEPPLPVTYPEMVPLFDEEGKPLPQPKDNGTYRYDNSGGLLPEGVWIWKDSASKDQVSGQVFAMVALYDAMKDDPAIDQALVERMQQDALGLAQVLMTKRAIDDLEGPVGKGEYDLMIMDADGRPTYHHDLNPLSLEKLYLTEEQGSFNVFNLFMAMGVMKGLYHVTGDPAIESYIYEELLHNRGYLQKMKDALDATKGALDYIYAGIMTNFDNPDMTGVALWLATYTESDPEVLDVLHHFLEQGWWKRKGESHTAALCKQPFWHVLYLGLTREGVEPAVVEEARDLLLAFDLGPYWNPVRINCDAEEIEAGECLAVDGKTVLTLDGKDDGGDWMATEALDPSIRPPSNFDARSNPFSVNGGGGLRLNPGGDLLAAYWMGRYLDASPAGEGNRSPHARSHMPVGGWPETPPEADDLGTVPDVVPQPDVPAEPDLVAIDSRSDGPWSPEPEPKKKNGGCAAGDTPAFPGADLLALLLLLAWVRRTRQTTV